MEPTKGQTETKKTEKEKSSSDDSSSSDNSSEDEAKKTKQKIPWRYKSHFGDRFLRKSKNSPEDEAKKSMQKIPWGYKSHFRDRFVRKSKNSPEAEAKDSKQKIPWRYKSHFRDRFVRKSKNIWDDLKKEILSTGYGEPQSVVIPKHNISGQPHNLQATGRIGQEVPISADKSTQTMEGDVEGSKRAEVPRVGSTLTEDKRATGNESIVREWHKPGTPKSRSKLDSKMSPKSSLCDKQLKENESKSKSPSVHRGRPTQVAPSKDERASGNISHKKEDKEEKTLMSGRKGSVQSSDRLKDHKNENKSQKSESRISPERSKSRSGSKSSTKEIETLGSRSQELSTSEKPESRSFQDIPGYTMPSRSSFHGKKEIKIDEKGTKESRPKERASRRSTISLKGNSAQ